MKKIKYVILSFMIVFTILFGIIPSEKVVAASYNANAALDYARAHWNDGQGLCAEFVSRCAQAGGINMPVITTTYECYKKIIELTGVPGQDLTLNSSGYATYAANSSKLAAGDVVVQWCYTCNLRPHILLCGGYNTSGNATFYAHNGALNNGVYRLNQNSQHKSTCNIGAKVIHLTAITDTTAPVISDVHVTDVNSEGYTVVCCVEDAGGVSKVQFPTWTHANDQDDLLPDWTNDTRCRGIQNGTTWSFRVNASEHNYEGGWYCTHIYAWDVEGNLSSAGTDAYVDRTAPVISDVQVTEVNSNGYTVTCKVEDDWSGVSRVQFPTWTSENGQDDLAGNWELNSACTGTQNGLTWSYHVSRADHNNETGFYNTHIYAWDALGNRSGSIELNAIYVKEPDPVEELTVGEVHIDTIEGDIYYYCNISGGTGASTAKVTITTDTGASKEYIRPIKDGKVDNYLYWMDFPNDMEAVFTITVSVTDMSGNTASNSSSIDARAEVSITPGSVTMKVGESFQFSPLKKGVFCVDSEKWNIYLPDRDKGAISISDNGLVTAFLPGEYRIEYQIDYAKYSIMPDDWDDNEIFLGTGWSTVAWLTATVNVELPAPDIRTIIAEQNGNVNLSIQESAGAENYEISIQQINNGIEGDTISRKIKAGESSQTFSGLKEGSVWKCKVRAYCNIGEQTYYSDWSEESTVTIASTSGSSSNNGTQKGPDIQKPGNNLGPGNIIQNYTPKKTTVSGKLITKSKGFTVKWKKQKSVAGYQVQYSTSKKFTKKTTKIKTVKKASTTKLTVKKLKAKKKYYVRVRTYRVVNGKKYYSGWSKSKTVRTK